MPSPSSSSSAVSTKEVQALHLQIAEMQAEAETLKEQLAAALATISDLQRKIFVLVPAVDEQNQRFVKLLAVCYEFISVAAVVTI